MTAAAEKNTDHAVSDSAGGVVRVLLENRALFLAFLERRVGNRDVAEEILQDAFVRGLDRGASVREQESAVAWFYRVLRNAIADHFRANAAERRAIDRLGREPSVAEIEPDAALMQQACACVTRLLGTLKHEYATALRRVDLEGASAADLAAELNITENNANVRVHRAREALRRQVVRSCGACGVHECLECECGSNGPHSAG